MKLTTFLLATALVACGGTASSTTSTTEATTTTTPTETLRGSIELRQGTAREEEPCAGRDGYDDMAGGAQVVVRNGDGDIIATTRLDPGVQILVEGMDNFWYCTFTFEAELPPDESFYTVEVSHRGELSYSAAEMAAQNWTIDLVLGD